MKINAQHYLEDAKIIQTRKNKKLFGKDMLDTIIIHYTAGRDAVTSAEFLSRDEVKASAHLVIGREGEIYQLVPFNIESWHAGSSSYGSRTGYNKYSIGIELDNAGVLTKAGSEYTSWFKKKYPESDALSDIHRNESSPRYWHTYTEKQIERCQEVCQILIDKYSIQTILGHEEISPGRKTDPGPAFPLDKLRDVLLTQNRMEEVETSKDGIVVADLLNIREGAANRFSKVAKPLTRGKKVKVLEERDGWLKVEVSIEGWVSKGFINVD